MWGEDEWVSESEWVRERSESVREKENVCVSEWVSEWEWVREWEWAREREWMRNIHLCIRDCDDVVMVMITIWRVILIDIYAYCLFDDNDDDNIFLLRFNKNDRKLHLYTERERERNRKRETERETDRLTDRETERERLRDWETEREREKQKERLRDRETERQTETDRERDWENERHTENPYQISAAAIITSSSPNILIHSYILFLSHALTLTHTYIRRYDPSYRIADPILSFLNDVKPSWIYIQIPTILYFLYLMMLNLAEYTYKYLQSYTFFT